MKKLGLLSILIFILIAVSWFSPARCQTVDRDELIKKYGTLNKKKNQEGDTYKSADIFGKSPDFQAPIPNEQASANLEVGQMDVVKTEEPIQEEPDPFDELSPFGYDLFNVPSEKLLPSDVSKIDDYILGPGDNLIIYLWGKVEKEYNLTVDRQGRVFIPKIGEMVVWGMPLDQFESQAKAKLSKSYSDFSISISLGKIRSIRIYLTGEVKRPGAYTVSSLTTLFNALYLAGGPNERGSMRAIKLIRNNRDQATLDLYNFLLKGESSGDIRLESGDAIFIPVSGPRVAITGEIKRPGIYEILGNETVSQFIELAGRTTAEAYLDRVMIDRISSDDEWNLLDLDLSADNSEPDNIAMRDGDRLTIFSIFEMKRNVVSIAGKVKHPGYFERNDSTSLKTLIMQSELRPDNVYYERANLFRTYPDKTVEIIPVNLNYVLNGQFNMPLIDRDSLHIYGIDDVIRKKHVYIDGEILTPGRYDYYENMTAYDLVFLAGNLNNEASLYNVELARANDDNQIRLQKIDLNNPDQAQILLQEDDRIYVRRMPDWFRHRTITIEGEALFPGEYALLSQNESLYDILRRAGGFTQNAFPQGTIFKRQSITESLEKQNISEIIAGTQPLIQDSLGNVRPTEIVRINSENINRIIIDIDEIVNSDGTLGDLKLQHNDYIYIPPIPSGISVMGAVSSNGTIRYTAGKNVNYYIKRAGNFSNQADKKRTNLVKADGRVYSGRSIESRRVDLGDAIVVPTQIKKDRDWLKILSMTASIIGGFATTALIMDRL